LLTPRNKRKTRADAAKPLRAEKGASMKRNIVPSTVSALAGFTVAELAHRYRVSEERVRNWIRRGELRAINRRDTRSHRPSWVVTVEALQEFECGRQAAVVEPPKPKRRKRTEEIDFFPD
jgi:transposase